jgi:hypothetical protein
VTYPWEEWRSLLIAAFPTSDGYHQKLQTMMQRVKRVEETYFRYDYEKLALLNQCEINGEKAVSCLIAGIQDVVVRTGSQAGRYTDPSALLEYLKGCDTTSTSHKVDNYQRDSRRDALHRPAANRSKKWRTFAKTARHSFGQRTFQSERLVCYGCNKPGHLKRDCPSTSTTRKCVLTGHGCHPWFFAQHTSSGIVGCLQNSLFC